MNAKKAKSLRQELSYHPRTPRTYRQIIVRAEVVPSPEKPMGKRAALALALVPRDPRKLYKEAKRAGNQR